MSSAREPHRSWHQPIQSKRLTGAALLIGRFLTVGLACALLHNVLVIGGDLLRVHYVASTMAAFPLVVLLGYRLHTLWTFPDARRGPVSLARYASSMLGNLPLFVAGMFVFADALALPVALASPIVTVLLTLFNFVASRWALRG